MNTKALLPIVLATFLVLNPVQSFFILNAVHNIATSVLDGVNEAVGHIINTIIPSSEETPEPLDNTASRLLQTISSASPGVLRETFKELNTSSTEVEAYRQSVLDSLQVTETTPDNLRILMQLLETFIDTVPRSTLDTTGVLTAVPEVFNALQELKESFNSSQLNPIILKLEVIAINLVSNFGPMRNSLNDLPQSLIYLSDHLIDDREMIMIEGQNLIQQNATQIAAISNLINAINTITDSVQVILQSIQNVISNTRLNFENSASAVNTQIQSIIRDRLKELPRMLSEATDALSNLPETITKDMEDALAYNELAVAESIKLAGRLNGVAGNSLDLLNRQIQSSISTIQKSAGPTVSIIVSQLQSLVNATQTGITNAVTTSSNNMYSSFDNALSTIERNVINGALNSEKCVDEALKRVQEISEVAIESLANCARENAMDSSKFINSMLDQADELLVDICSLADKLDECSNLYSATSSASVTSWTFKLTSCLQSVYASVRQSMALSHLSNVQVEITNKINMMHSSIHTCVNQALNDADNSAVTLEKNAETCFRSE